MLANLINVGHVRMIKCRRRLSLLHKAKHALTTESQFSRQNLQGHAAIELRVLGQVDLTHSALANLVQNFISTKFCAGSQWHICKFPGEALRSHEKSCRMTKRSGASYQRSSYRRLCSPSLAPSGWRNRAADHSIDSD